MINVQLWCFSHHVPLSLASWAVCLLQWTCDTKCSLLCGEKGRSCWITPWPSCEEICSATSISGCWLTTSTTTSFSLTLRCTCSASRTWELDWPVLHDTGVSDDQKLLSPQNVDPYKNFCFKYCPETDRASDHPTVYIQVSGNLTSHFSNSTMASPSSGTPIMRSIRRTTPPIAFPHCILLELVTS